IKIDTANINFSFLREIIKEIQSTKQKVKEKFQEILDIKEISQEKFNAFLNNWNNEIQSILTLASRFHQEYPEGKKLFSKIVLAEINNNYFQERYNLENNLTKQQLNPLIKNKSKQKQKEIIKTYHEGVNLIHISEPSKIEKPKEIYILEQGLKDELLNRFIEQKHIEQQLLGLKEFESFDEKNKKILQDFILFGLLSKEQRKEVKTTEEIKNCFDKENNLIIKGIICLHQFFKDLSFSQKSPTELLKNIDNLLKNLPEEMKELGIIQSDIGKFLKANIETKNKPEQVEFKRKILISHTTDHPKTLLEIGKYPLNTGSCQSYDYSDLNLVKSLLGFVFDAHILAIVIREIEFDEEIQAIMSLDEGKQIAIIKTKNGLEKQVKISKPIARSMVFLGEKEKKQGVFILQKNYSEPGGIENKLAEELEEKTLDKFIQTLNEKHSLNLRKREVEEKEIEISGSHNFEGHYNDLARGQKGENGESYLI
ncbi:MAG: hypothetical protein AAB732_02510, partial [Patescibacteria group bacterium]